MVHSENTQIEDLLTIGETNSTRVYWQDEAQIILIHDILSQWTWQDATESITLVNETIRKHEKSVYTIHRFHPESGMIPRGTSFSKLRHFMLDDPPNEEMVIILGASMMMETFLKTVKKAYGLAGVAIKYRYVKTLDAALDLIAEHRQVSIT